LRARRGPSVPAIKVEPEQGGNPVRRAPSRKAGSWKREKGVQEICEADSRKGEGIRKGSNSHCTWPGNPTVAERSNFIKKGVRKRGQLREITRHSHSLVTLTNIKKNGKTMQGNGRTRLGGTK